MDRSCKTKLFPISHNHIYVSHLSAGSAYRATVVIPYENRPKLSWKCNGAVCTLIDPNGKDLSLSSCQFLVSKIGEITFYGNSEQKLWEKNHSPLTQCNKSAR